MTELHGRRLPRDLAYPSCEPLAGVQDKGEAAPTGCGLKGHRGPVIAVGLRRWSNRQSRYHRGRLPLSGNYILLVSYFTSFNYPFTFKVHCHHAWHCAKY